MVPAENYETFADAILKKLITEIAARGAYPGAADTGAPARTCIKCESDKPAL